MSLFPQDFFDRTYRNLQKQKKKLLKKFRKIVPIFEVGRKIAKFGTILALVKRSLVL